MGETLTFLPDLKLVHVRVDQDLNLGVLRRLAFQAHLTVRQLMSVDSRLISLVDLGAARVIPEDDLVEQAVTLQDRLGEHYPFYRRAIVAQDPALLAICRRFVELSRDRAVTSQVFNALPSALEWLELDPELAHSAPFNGQPREDSPCT
ncbi:MAG: hypothetical protein KDC10_04290 [Calditrichaeota bacterium]|nr:hypothetical protein [Candidatus Cloacimonadota bacterium]MCA9787163.1 hypothetical protein [Candidatus Cloacimonadota bacterium]MCB1046400.1 hypothetical protein [Calditrichota bacterium]MCB9474803.1 hypothetical protein [Candidatus Delongbacteria bacterium]